MVNTFFVTYFKIGYKQKEEIQEYDLDFGFPYSRPSLKEKWIHFVNRLHWMPTQRSRICSKHFDEKYLKQELRTKLRCNLIWCCQLQKHSGKSLTPVRKSI